MLLNQKGQVVQVNPKFSSKDHPNQFIHLREVKDILPPQGSMFKLETRARIKS